MEKVSTSEVYAIVSWTPIFNFKAVVKLAASAASPDVVP